MTSMTVDMPTALAPMIWHAGLSRGFHRRADQLGVDAAIELDAETFMQVRA